MIDYSELDALIPAEEWAKIEADRAKANARLEKARQLARTRAADAEEPHAHVEESIHYHDEPFEREYIGWAEVGQVLLDRAYSNPGEWTRLRSNAANRNVVTAIRKDRIGFLRGLNVEAFARHAKPRSDGQPTGWEIYARAVRE